VPTSRVGDKHAHSITLSDPVMQETDHSDSRADATLIGAKTEAVGAHVQCTTAHDRRLVEESRRANDTRY
jgi:hypothetical protein